MTLKRTSPSPGRWMLLAATAAGGVAVWEYLLMAVFNPEVDWNIAGVLAHFTLDVGLLLPVAAFALGAALFAARRFGFAAPNSGRPTDVSALLGTFGLLVLAWALFALPVTAGRDLLHENFGNRFDLYLAEVQTTIVKSDLTVQEAKQLCSFGSVRNPSLTGELGFVVSVQERLRAAARDALIQLAALLPLIALLFVGLQRGRLPLRDPSPPRPQASRRRAVNPWRRTVRLGTVSLAAFALYCTGLVLHNDQAQVAYASFDKMAPLFDACTDGGEVREYHVSAIDVDMTLNRWGDYVEEAYMYALDANIPAVRAFEAAIEADRDKPDDLAVARVSHGLRKDPIQPMVLRANLGECLRVHFTNRLDEGEPASMHILGLPHRAENASSAVGNNPDSTAAPGETVTYNIPLPLDLDAERAYYFHDHGAGRRRQNMGLFGAIVAEPPGSTYLDVETGEPLQPETGSNWEAIIVDSGSSGADDAKSFREFVIFYHEIGDEAFTDIRDRDGKKLPLIDEIAGVYRPAARALNYRSEPFRRRLEVEKTGKALGYASYPFGDPATPIPRSYLGEGVKTRLLHGGSEVFHVHHLHGGGDRWRRNPNADPNSNFWKGLTKVPDPNLQSIHLDSQSIGPGTSYNLEHECGAGGCQQGAGDFLYHCHIGHHYISGMWSFWRVFDTVQDHESNLYGRPLAIVPQLFQNDDNPLIPPEPPRPGVSAGELIGVVVDDGRTIVANDDLTDPSTQIDVLSWVAGQLPPPGVRLDKHDATVWNWLFSGDGAAMRIWGEPESDEAFAGYVSDSPGERPEVLFNPKNGRYAWPLFRPQKGQRPPFTARHSGAPWLGEQMKKGRLDGLCAANNVHPSVDVGQNAKRFYPVSSIPVPLQISPDSRDDDGMIFVLNEEEAEVRSGEKAAEPLTIRSNVGDCVEIVFTNKIPDGPLNKEFSKTNIHSHFVQFDTQASDGVITGMSYEQAVRPIESEDRRLTSAVGAGSLMLPVNHTERLRKGIWIGVGLGEGTCGTNSQGQPVPCTEIAKIKDLGADFITLDRPLSHGHDAGEAVGVEFVRYNWYSDVDFGTVFFHTHVEFKDWDHGLFGSHIVEPKGSTYHDPRTGDPVRSGSLVDIRVDPSAGGNPVAWNVDGSFREFVLYLHDNNPAEGQFVRGGGTINLRAEPWRLRESAADAYRFSSVTHGDPFTPLVRAYVGDPVVVRGMGLVERVGGVRFTGHRFQQERVNAASDTRDTTFIGISERFDVSLEGGAGGTGRFPGDYLYYSTLGRDFESGAWGILRVHDKAEGDLQPLPDQPPPPAGDGFPQQSFTGEPPPRLFDGPGAACPPAAPVRSYDLVVRGTSIIYNGKTTPDAAGVAYWPFGEGSFTGTRSTPLVVRANAGDCLELNLANPHDRHASISVGELVFDPQRSYGAAIGYNFDTTIPPGQGRRFRYYADRELGLTLALNLADLEATEQGAFAGVVIEPEGAVYYRPGRDEPLPNGGIGVQADIEVDGVRMREFVALFNDQDRRIGQNAMPYPIEPERSAGINYSREPLGLRDQAGRPADVFKSSLWGDPRHVVTVPAGTPLIYRVGHAWGNQMHVPTIEGHRWLQEPGMEGSEQVASDALAPGMTLDLYMVGGAGGDIAAPGDFLFLDRRQPFLEFGLWNILRVTADGTSGADDVVNILFATDEQAGTALAVRGKTTLRPAGDFAGQVTVHSGQATDGACTGPVLGTASVDPGSGDFFYRGAIGSVPPSVCVTSEGGGVATRAL